MMLQQDKLEDFMIATGVQCSVREFINKTAMALGMTLNWPGSGINEVATWAEGANGRGKPVIKIDARYYRPTEVETLLGDPAKAKMELGWKPKITLDEMVAEMVVSDLEATKRVTLLVTQGFSVAINTEN